MPAGKFEKRLSELEKIITERFQGFEQILIGADAKLARTLMKAHTDINIGLDEITISMVKYKGDELTSSDAVTLALYARYLKRISSHLTNIASSAVNPFPRIGYREKVKS